MHSMKLTKDDLCLVARTKGWPGGNPTKQSMLDWFQQRGITMEEVYRTVAQMRAAARGQTVGAPAGPSLDQVTALIERTMAAKQAITAQTTNVPPAELIAALTKDAATMRLFAAAVAKAGPGRIILNGESDTKPVRIDGRVHPQFEKILKLVKAGVNVLLVGPAGCGKTTLAHQLAMALKRKFGMLSCTSGASEAQLTGWLLPVGSGKPGEFTYIASEFVRLYEEGNSVFLFDEFDAADPNMALVINSALANGALHVPQRHKEPLVTRGKNVALIAAANTFGSGADLMYAGRNQLDAATLDRFYVIELDYDVELEKELGDEAVCQWVWNLRTKVKQQRIRRVVSTRTIQRVTAAIRSGVPLPEAKRDALAGWTKDELAKVGE